MARLSALEHHAVQTTLPPVSSPTCCRLLIQRKPRALDTCTSALQITSVTLLECVVLAIGTRATGTELAPLLVNVLDHMKEVEAAVRAHMQMAMISGDNCV